MRFNGKSILKISLLGGGVIAVLAGIIFLSTAGVRFFRGHREKVVFSTVVEKSFKEFPVKRIGIEHQRERIRIKRKQLQRKRAALQAELVKLRELVTYLSEDRN